MTSVRKTAVLLLAHGSPESPEEIPEYLERVTSGRTLPPRVVEEITQRYQLVGFSHLTSLTMKQRDQLARELDLPVYCGMRNWKPFIGEVLKKMAADGVDHAVLICLAPHNSRTSVGLYRRAVEGDGKLPFTFDLPELQNTPFTLIGGKVIYLRQAPGAELMFGLRQHRISLFIFQQRAVGSLHAADSTLPGSSLNVHAWSSNGLEYLLVGDVGQDDLNRLQALLRSGG